MVDGYFKVVRLKTGEMILCAMENDISSIVSITHLTLIEPVQIVQMRETTRNNEVVGESFAMRPWIGMSDSDEFVITTDIVLTIGNQKHEIKKQYLQYVTSTAQTKKKIRERLERDEAIEQLLRDVTPGEVRIIDEDYPYYGEYDEYEED